mmetsp:Transcript_32578/g.69383  ORF Transcript_32578/g.69383 Transcript_32578/m.69383 type:complete len:248 (+) Transcript_32578:626-1369(+)
MIWQGNRGRRGHSEGSAALRKCRPLRATPRHWEEAITFAMRVCKAAGAALRRGRRRGHIRTNTDTSTNGFKYPCGSAAAWLIIHTLGNRGRRGHNERSAALRMSCPLRITPWHWHESVRIQWPIANLNNFLRHRYFVRHTQKTLRVRVCRVQIDGVRMQRSSNTAGIHLLCCFANSRFTDLLRSVFSCPRLRRHWTHRHWHEARHATDGTFRRRNKSLACGHCGKSLRLPHSDRNCIGASMGISRWG